MKDKIASSTPTNLHFSVMFPDPVYVFLYSLKSAIFKKKHSKKSKMWVFIYQLTPKRVKPSLKPLQKSEIPRFQGVKRRTTRERVVLRLTLWKSGISLFWSGFVKGITPFGVVWWMKNHIPLFLEWFYHFTLLGSEVFTLLHLESKFEIFWIMLWPCFCPYPYGTCTSFVFEGHGISVPNTYPNTFLKHFNQIQSK